MAKRTQQQDEVLLFPLRKGYRAVRSEIQRDSLDQATLNRLWNVVYQALGGKGSKFRYEIVAAGQVQLREYEMYPSSTTEAFANVFYDEYLNETLDELPFDYEQFRRHLKEKMLSAWYEALGIVEFIAQKYPFENNEQRKQFEESVNKVLESEKTAYRLRDGVIQEV